MITLSLDCSLESIFLVLSNENEVIRELSVNPEGQHSETLLQTLTEFLNQEKTDQVLFFNGPGKFTSLRVGAVTLLGLFYDQSLKVLNASSLLLRCLALESEKKRVAIMPAGREKYYVGILSQDSFEEYHWDLKTFEAWCETNSQCFVVNHFPGRDDTNLISLLEKHSAQVEQSILKSSAILKLLQEKKSVHESSLKSIQLNYLQPAV